MGGITNQQQARTVPPGQAIRLHRENGDLFPLLDGVETVGKFWQHLSNGLAQMLEACSPNLLVATLWNDIAHLPVIVSVEHDQDVTAAYAATGLFWVACFSW